MQQALSEQKDLVSIHVFRNERTYGLMCAILPQGGLTMSDLDVQIKLRTDPMLHEANGSNPCLYLDHDICGGVEAILITIGQLRYYYTYEELLKSLRPHIANAT